MNLVKMSSEVSLNSMAMTVVLFTVIFRRVIKTQWSNLWRHFLAMKVFKEIALTFS